MDRTATGRVSREWREDKGWFWRETVHNPYSLQELARIKINDTVFARHLTKLQLPVTLEKYCKSNYIEDVIYCTEERELDPMELSVTDFDRPARSFPEDIVVLALQDRVRFIEEDDEKFWFFRVYWVFEPRQSQTHERPVCEHCYNKCKNEPLNEVELAYEFEWINPRRCSVLSAQEIREEISMSHRWCSMCNNRTLFFAQAYNWWNNTIIEDSDETD